MSPPWDVINAIVEWLKGRLHAFSLLKNSFEEGFPIIMWVSCLLILVNRLKTKWIFMLAKYQSPSLADALQVNKKRLLWFCSVMPGDQSGNIKCQVAIYKVTSPLSELWNFAGSYWRVGTHKKQWTELLGKKITDYFKDHLEEGPQTRIQLPFKLNWMQKSLQTYQHWWIFLFYYRLFNFQTAIFVD